MNWKTCKRCPLCEGRRKVVYGEGSLPCDVLFIGQAPGVTEDATGRPFIGPSGKLLRAGINQALNGVGGSYRMYITNVVGCYPPEDRQPVKAEILECRERVEEIFDAAKPRALVLLGTVAKLNCRYLGKRAKVKVVELLHPAYILQHGGEDSTEFLHFWRVLKEEAFNENEDGES